MLSSQVGKVRSCVLDSQVILFSGTNMSQWKCWGTQGLSFSQLLIDLKFMGWSWPWWWTLSLLVGLGKIRRKGQILAHSVVCRVHADCCTRDERSCSGQLRTQYYSPLTGHCLIRFLHSHPSLHYQPVSQFRNIWVIFNFSLLSPPRTCSSQVRICLVKCALELPARFYPSCFTLA